MAEFAAATGAAGLVSLGLQVCGGLISYYSAWKDTDTETAVFCTRAHQLVQTLEILTSVLSTSQGNQSVALATVEASIVSCAGPIQDLQRKLAKYRPQPTVGSAGVHGLRLKRRMMYPFERSELIFCNNAINDLNSNLSTALQAYQIEQTRAVSNQHQSFADRMLAEMTLLSLRLASLDTLNQNIQHVQQTVMDASENSEARLDVIQSSLVTRPDLRQRLNEQISDRIQELDTDENPLTAPLFNGLPPPSVMPSDNYSKANRCSCGASRKTRDYYAGLISTSVRRHDPKCPLHRFSKSTDTTKISLNFPTFLKIASLRVTLITLRGAQGYAIHQTLLCSRVIPDDHLAVRLLSLEGRRSELSPARTREEIRGMFASGQLLPTDVNQQGETPLSMLLQKITMTNISDDWETMRHSVMDLVSAGLPVNESMRIDSGSNIWYGTALDYIITFFPGWTIDKHHQANMALDFIGADGETSGSEHHADICFDVVAASNALASELDISDFGRALAMKSATALRLAIAQHPEWINDPLFDGRPPIHIACVDNWPDGLRILIDAGADIETLDVGHPRISPLAWAVRYGSAECTRLLLEAGCAVVGLTGLFTEALKADSAGKAKPECGGIVDSIIAALIDRRALLKDLAGSRADPLTDQFSRDRQGRVQDTSAWHLSQYLEDVGIETPQDLRCWRSDVPLYNALASMSSEDGTVGIAQRLWDLGFTETQASDEMGCQASDCLLYRLADGGWLDPFLVPDGFHFAQFLEWLQAHPDPESADPGASLIPSAMLLAAIVGDCNRSACWETQGYQWCPLYAFSIAEYSAGELTVSIDNLRPTPADPLTKKSPRIWVRQQPACCACYCSLQGCNPTTAFLGAMTSVGKHAGGERYPLDVASVEYGRLKQTRRHCIANLMDVSCDGRSSTSPSLAEDIIRLEVFESMGLRHTCCHISHTQAWDCSEGEALRRDRTPDERERHPTLARDPLGDRGFAELKPLDPDLVREIHEEYAEAIVRFEQVLPQLIEGYWTSGLHLVEYLDGPFDEQIEQILAADGRLHPKQLKAIEALGVRIEACDVQDEDAALSSERTTEEMV